MCSGSGGGGGSGVFQRMFIVYDGGGVSKGLSAVDGSGIFNLGKGLHSGDCRTGSGGLRTGGEACCKTGLGLPVAAYQPAVTTSVHSQSYTPPIFKGPLCSSPPFTHWFHTTRSGVDEDWWKRKKQNEKRETNSNRSPKQSSFWEKLTKWRMI